MLMASYEEIVDAFEVLSDAGNGVLAIPPQTLEERKDRHRLMQEYLQKRNSDKSKQE
jgi:hypothetical protein